MRARRARMKKTILIPIVIVGRMAFAAESLPVASESGAPVAVPSKGDFKSLDEPAAPSKSEDPKVDSSKFETFSSAVNVIRASEGRTEVVFRNGESYYLPRGAKNAAIFKACEDSSNDGKALSVTVNSRTRIIESVAGATAATGAKAK